MIELSLPEASTGEIVALDRLEAPALLSGIAKWRALKGEGHLPARPHSLPRLLGPLLRNVILVRVLEGGADYEYRVVGDTVVQGFHENFSGRRLSYVLRKAPKLGFVLRMLYERVRGSGMPLAYRGWLGRDMPHTSYIYNENVLLPFAADGHGVDHILILTALIPRHRTAPPRPVDMPSLGM